MANELHNAKFLQIVPPAAIVDDAAITTAEIDTLGWDYLTMVCSVGATDIAMAALKLQAGNTSGALTDYDGLDFDGDTDIEGGTAALPADDDDNGLFVFQVDLKARPRYWDLVATAGDGSTGTFFSCTAILSRGEVAPLTATEMGAKSALRV
ncbi:hypothetical protein NHH03_25260 [Stieleria sp. TO1_6]|uniref:hypothetical protein n=1 Tax=Stieleria tagensis TaxID=2956795 RepID=UPI00209A9B17|nr:hypothetical protein [Stieleria tagensis]MCO8125070.1 hypothetical protein [Stieleria tagensis]